MKIVDYIIVGSGCSGAMAAQTLVESGAEVTMIDTGFIAPDFGKKIPDQDFLDIRKNDEDQYRYFIGPSGEGIQWTDIGKGAQITPPRTHLISRVDTLIPTRSTTFSPVESLGYGGLGIGWGLQCWEYSQADAERAGLDYSRLVKAYDVVSSRIGVSATPDDAANYTIGKLSVYQPSPHMDRNHAYIYEKYRQKNAFFHKKGIYIGRTPLALITQNMGGRKGYRYRDMDFYSDADRSAWRPWITVDRLRKESNFSYIGNQLVIDFEEKAGGTVVKARNTNTGQITQYRCKKLILAAGALGSARIVLRSFSAYAVKLPLLCNPYTYVPCIQPRLLGSGSERQKLGFAQLSMFLDETSTHANTSVASLYSYQSLMMFRTIRQLPFGFADNRKLLDYLMPAIVIMGIHHPDAASSAKYLRLVRDSKSFTGDTLNTHYALDDTTQRELEQREKKLINALRHTNTFAIKKINPGYGASIHYAGTLPFSHNDEPLTLAPNGRLHGTRSVFVADSSGFNFLPAQGLTFSLLANSHNVAENTLNER